MSLLKRITGAADLAAAGKPGSWTDDAARATFVAAYERAFALWPQPHEEFDVETATATTRVHAYRPHPAGDPIVLLSGAGSNASGWFPHVAALAADGCFQEHVFPHLPGEGSRRHRSGGRALVGVPGRARRAGAVRRAARRVARGPGRRRHRP